MHPNLLRVKLKLVNIANIFYLFFVFTSMILEVRAADYHSARTESLGGAGHGGPVLSDSIYLNPSFASLTRIHSLGIGYLPYSGDVSGHLLNLSVLDGTPESLFQAGIGYTRREDVSLIHIGASKSIFNRLSVGLGSKFIFPNGTGDRITDGTFSATGILAHWIQSSFIIDNLFQSATAYGFYREYTLGTKLNIMGIIQIYFDPNWTPTLPTHQAPWGYQIGSEFTIFSDLFLRLGSYTNSNIPYLNQRGNGYGIGAGWIGPRLTVDYSFSRVTYPLSTYANNFNLTIFF